MVVASTAGGNFMMDFFNSLEGWQVQPIYQELKQWTNSLSAAPEGERIDAIAQIVQRLPESLDYMVVRESACDHHSCAVRVIGNRDLKRVDELITREGDKLFYESLDANRPPILLNTQTLNPYLAALSKADFLHYSKLVEKCINRAIKEDTTWCSSSQWTELTQPTLDQTQSIN